MEYAEPGDVHPPPGSRRLSGSHPRPRANSTGQTSILWLLFALPVRIVVGAITGTWYFLGEYSPPFDAEKLMISPDVHTPFRISTSTTIPPPSVGAILISRSTFQPDSDFTIICERPRDVYWRLERNEQPSRLLYRPLQRVYE